ncbi:MAG: hypothetical protein IJZ72_09140 [Oscillospiraceae bacterium]|nr:hypothetical protein [Oscillospiraceae bacterium]
MNIKKKISLVLALLMSVSMLATGCKKTDEDTPGLTEATTTTAAVTEETTAATITQMTTEATTAPTETTTEETATEETTVSETTAPEETTTVEETTTTPAETTEATTTTAAKDWNETVIDEVMYTSNNCYARVVPKYGADPVKQYLKGVKVKVVAHTDTGYYKLEDGSFIHADYLTENDPAATTTAATTKVTADTAIEDGEEVIYDDDYTGDDKAEDVKGDDKKEDDKPQDTGSTSAPAAGSTKFKNRYGYKTLTAAQQELYANIVKAAENLDPKAAVPEGILSNDVKKVYGMVFNQEPQLFWLSGTIPSGYTSLRMNYTVSSVEERDAIQKKIDKNANAVLAAANQYSSTFSKLKVFYDWIVTNSEFSVSNTAAACSIENGMTGGGELQCAGYAKTMMYLCDLAGIECMTITGRNDEGSSHAWNVVYCDNGYYNLDTAWGDPMNEHDSKYVRYNFFLVPDAWIVNDHLSINQVFMSDGTSIKYFDPPACTKSSCNYFKAYNKEYSTVESAAQAMYDELEAAIKAGRNVAHIRVTDASVWETLHSTEYAKKFQTFAKGKGNVSKLARQKRWSEGVLVVQYDIFYN